MFYCRALKLANFLIANGSTLLKIMRNPNNEGFLIFVFKQDETLAPNLEKWKVERDDFYY